MVKYEAASDGVITKDGHVMMVEDVVKDLNRKAYLEVRNDTKGYFTEDYDRLAASFSCDGCVFDVGGCLVAEQDEFDCSGYIFKLKANSNEKS